MYLPSHFSMTERDAVDEAARRGFGTLVVGGVTGLEASPMPFLLDGGAMDEGGPLRLVAHVARANPLVELLAAPTAALMVVDVADGYVSPSWYPSKAEHQRVVPTWNYVAVHLHGIARAATASPWLRELVARLTDHHEAAMPAPWSVDDAPAEYLAGALRGIVGIEMEVTRVEGKAKLSQNRPAVDAEGAEQGQRAAGRTALADRMARARQGGSA